MKTLHAQHQAEWGSDNFRLFKSASLKTFLSLCKLLEDERKPTGFLARVSSTSVSRLNPAGPAKTENQRVFEVGGHKTSRILDELLKINRKVGFICPHAEAAILMTYSAFKR